MQPYDSPTLTQTAKQCFPRRPEIALSLPVNLKASTTYPRGTLLGEVTATPGTFGAYASGNSDGTQIPKCVLQIDCITDASGNIYAGSVVPNINGRIEPQVQAWFRGEFKMADLVGLDANAVTAMGARILYGTVAANNGEIAF